MFLREVAENLYKRFGRDISGLAIVFPNRRPAVFFRHWLGGLIEQPIWCPELFTIFEFIQLSDQRPVADRLMQSFLLYESFLSVRQQDGGFEEMSFERFYPLGEILLNDFAELEANCIPIDDLYRTMASISEIEQGVDYLTGEQQEYLKRFWKNFSVQRLSAQKEKFLKLWKLLPALFEKFRECLDQQGLTTTGTLYRNLAAGKPGIPEFSDRFEKIVFVGFNALNKAELQLTQTWKEQGRAIFFFDTDAHYMEDPLQEAGLFLRRNLAILGNELQTSHRINRADRPLHIIETEGNAAQARLLPQLLETIPGIKEHPERVAIILSDEQQLLPVLHALPSTVPAINITMGYGLSQSPVFSLVQYIIRLQEALARQGGDKIYYRPLLQFLQHPYLLEIKEAETLVTEINKRNLVTIGSEQWAQLQHPVIAPVLRMVKKPLDLIGLIRKVLELQTDTQDGSAISGMETQLIAAVYCQLNRLEGLFEKFEHPLSLSFIGDTILQVLGNLRVPLEGEPLKGLQVMGLLESRGLDFEQIIILNVNEGVLPRAVVAPTFIPDSIRRAYGLSVPEKQDAIFAYVFYRLFQRSRAVYCLFDRSTTDRGVGEQSRFLSQLEYETRIPVTRQVLDLNIRPLAKAPICIQKEEAVMQTMRRFTGSLLSPSAINNYIECRLLFYFKHVARLEEAETLTEEIDARLLGILLHNAMQYLYTGLAKTKQSSGLVEKQDFEFLKQQMQTAIDSAFGEEMGGDPDYRVHYTGAYILVVEVLKEYISAILDYDREYAPFTILAMEEKTEREFPVAVNGKTWKIKLGGYIDRMDLKDGIFRIIDYKTGSDKKEFNSMASLFDREERDRNKAVLQTLIYSYLVKQAKPGNISISAGIYDIRNMRKEGAAFNWQFVCKEEGGEFITHQQMPSYIDATIPHLQNLLEEIFDEAVPFDQTSRLEKCERCPYKVLCGR